jgi:hypothetical protein
MNLQKNLKAERKRARRRVVQAFGCPPVPQAIRSALPAHRYSPKGKQQEEIKIGKIKIGKKWITQKHYKDMVIRGTFAWGKTEAEAWTAQFGKWHKLATWPKVKGWLSPQDAGVPAHWESWRVWFDPRHAQPPLTSLEAPWKGTQGVCCTEGRREEVRLCGRPLEPIQCDPIFSPATVESSGVRPQNYGQTWYPVAGAVTVEERRRRIKTRHAHEALTRKVSAEDPVYAALNPAEKRRKNQRLLAVSVASGPAYEALGPAVKRRVYRFFLARPRASWKHRRLAQAERGALTPSERIALRLNGLLPDDPTEMVRRVIVRRLQPHFQPEEWLYYPLWELPRSYEEQEWTSTLKAACYFVRGGAICFSVPNLRRLSPSLADLELQERFARMQAEDVAALRDDPLQQVGPLLMRLNGPADRVEPVLPLRWLWAFPSFSSFFVIKGERKREAAGCPGWAGTVYTLPELPDHARNKARRNLLWKREAQLPRLTWADCAYILKTCLDVMRVPR